MKWSQQELASRAGVSRQWIVALERAKPTTELGLVLKTLAVLGLKIDVRELARDATIAAALDAAAADLSSRTHSGGSGIRRLSTARARLAADEPRSPTPDDGAAA
jgi:DNA-binding XRE family transcriptional regulator